MLARPIIAPSSPNLSRISIARSGELTSPFPKMGMCILGLFLTEAIWLQSASPLYIWARVRPWMEIALQPTSCKRSATSTIFMEFSSQPKRVFTVIGRLVCFAMASVKLTIKSISFNIPAPAPLQTTFFTGQPKLMSIISGFDCSTISTVLNIDSKFAPNI